MLIGDVARRSGVSARMLRHYDRMGLVRPTGRTTGGYREYSEADIRRIFHVESLRTLGMSLAEVQRALEDTTFTPAALVSELVAETERRVAQGQELLGRLRRVDAAAPAAWTDVLRIVALLRALDSPQAAQRHRLVLSGDVDGLPTEALTEAYLAETEPNVAGALRWALARAGGDGVAGLVAGLGSTDTRVRRRAVDGLAAIDYDAAKAALRTALADRDEGVRARAALALGTRGGAEAVPELAAMVAQGRLDVEAAETLGGLVPAVAEGGAVVAALVAAAADGTPEVRRRLAQALVEVPDAAAHRELRALAQDEDRAVSLTARAVLDRAHGSSNPERGRSNAEPSAGE